MLLGYLPQQQWGELVFKAENLGLAEPYKAVLDFMVCGVLTFYSFLHMLGLRKLLLQVTIQDLREVLHLLTFST